MAERESTTTKLSGIEKAAVLLIALGPQTASSVLQQLSPDDVRKVCAQIAKNDRVETTIKDEILREFSVSQSVESFSGGIDYTKALLEQALGANKARDMITEISAGRRFNWLKSASLTRLATVLQAERPQIIALVVAYLAPDQAADVLSQLPEEMQGEIAYRLTVMQPVAPEIANSIEEILQEQLIGEGSSDLKDVGGLDALVSVLNNADRATERKILEYLEDVEASIAENVKLRMFVFEDIANLDSRAIQRIIREAEQEDMRLSLKGAAQAVKDAMFSNMSERAAEALKEDLETMGPVKVKDVEAARRRIVATVHRLEDAGEITIREDTEEVIN